MFNQWFSRHDMIARNLKKNCVTILLKKQTINFICIKVMVLLHAFAFILNKVESYSMKQGIPMFNNLTS